MIEDYLDIKFLKRAWDNQYKFKKMYKKQLIIENITMEEMVDIFGKMLDEKLKNLKPTPKSELLTQKEAAAMLKVTPKTIDNWIESCVLPAYTCGNRTYIKSEDIENSLVRKKI